MFIVLKQHFWYEMSAWPSCKHSSQGSQVQILLEQNSVHVHSMLRHFFQSKSIDIFSCFSTKNICCGYSLEALLMNTHNIRFRGEIRKIFTGYPPLTRSMMSVWCFIAHSLSLSPLYCFRQKMFRNT